jgi:hypothetical protein
VQRKVYQGVDVVTRNVFQRFQIEGPPQFVAHRQFAGDGGKGVGAQPFLLFLAALAEPVRQPYYSPAGVYFRLLDRDEFHTPPVRSSTTSGRYWPLRDVARPRTWQVILNQLGCSEASCLCTARLPC